MAPYSRVDHHWFFRKEVDVGRYIWEPFSKKDSTNLEEAFHSKAKDPKVIATDGGRFDVNINERLRKAVYWDAEPNEVRRCSWFFKGTQDGRFVPYTEEISKKLETEYKDAYELNEWHHKVDLNNGESVIFHGADILVHFTVAQSPDMWGESVVSTTQGINGATRPRLVKRGIDDIINDIDVGETTEIDHLLFMVHGVGSNCDLKFRNLIEVVDDFRMNCRQLVQSHYASAFESERANRIEVLPITWHDSLHSDETGVDEKIKKITLESIPRLRQFANDTILDIFFYLSPVYCETILIRVVQELNRVSALFHQRNPKFDGDISLAGHSLGSLIVFDLLSHQGNGIETSFLNPSPTFKYPQLNFNPACLFAIGSPIGMFLTVRGFDHLGEKFALPTCPSFFNIFHPYDPVAYRIEPLINPEAQNLQPFLVPHHKGRKRMHLELKEQMYRVGTDLKQKIIQSIRTTWNSIQFFTSLESSGTVAAIENEPIESTVIKEETIPEEDVPDISLGALNRGRRIDYVLQEAPVEFFNEYLFALQSHLCYWYVSEVYFVSKV